MFRKTMKKIACGVLATVSVAACAGTFAACETSHPEVKMQIEFNGETYTLNYKLYRKIAPTTVEHFLWLAGNGYYDGLCVHDYDEDNLRMYTGAYTAAEDASDDDGLVYKPYYQTIATYENYAKFPHSVWQDEEKTAPLYTLYGEFENNNFQVKNGALKESFGSLSMYYTDISGVEVAGDNVYAARADGKDEVAGRAYKYNSATSQFFISTIETETEQKNYCTFATLKKGSVDDLEALQEAIETYIDENYGTDEDDEEDFVEQEEVRVSQDDKIVGKYTVKDTYSVPKKAIVIKKVEVKKY